MSRTLVIIFGAVFLTLVIVCAINWPGIKKEIHYATAESDNQSPRPDKPKEQPAPVNVQAKPTQPDPPTRTAPVQTVTTIPAQPTAPPERPASPVWRSITNSSFIVASRAWYAVPFTVYAREEIARVKGDFSATGGTHNAINAYILDMEGFENFKNNSRFLGYWSTPGEMHTASFDLKLMAGDYVLVFDNRNSILTNKGVKVAVGLLPSE
jgi:hypothetical protein